MEPRRVGNVKLQNSPQTEVGRKDLRRRGEKNTEREVESEKSRQLNICFQLRKFGFLQI